MFDNPLYIDVFNIGTMAFLVITTGFISYRLFLKYKESDKNPAILMLALSCFMIMISTAIAIYTYVTEAALDPRTDLMEFLSLFMGALTTPVILRFMKIIFAVPGEKLYRIVLYIYFGLLGIITALFIGYSIVSVSGRNVTSELAIISFMLITLMFPIQFILYVAIAFQCSRIMGKIDRNTSEYNKLKYMRIWATFALLFSIIMGAVVGTSQFNAVYGITWFLAIISTFGAYRTYISRKRK